MAASLLKGTPHVFEDLLLALQWAVNGVWQPPCLHGAGSAAISSRQAGSFKESRSKVWTPNSSETHWPTFPCGPFIYQEMKLVTGFLTLPNLTDEIWFLPKFRRSLNSLLLSSISCLDPWEPLSILGFEEPPRQGKGWSGEQAVEWVWGLLP